MSTPATASRARAWALSIAMMLGATVSSSAVAAPAAPLSPEMRAIAVDEHRGAQLDGSLTFQDADGNTVRLEELWSDGKPVLLTLNYYSCKVICSVQLNGLADTLAAMEWAPGTEDFRVVTVSIDPREKPPLAKGKRTTLVERVGKGELDWTFLTGDALSIKALAAGLGVGYAYDAEQDQYAHPAVAMFVAPGGKISQYIYGLTFVERDVKFALMEASEGKLGSPVDQIIMSCFHYDASIGRYGPFAFGIMRLGGTATVVVLGLVLLGFWRRERQRGGLAAEVET